MEGRINLSVFMLSKAALNAISKQPSRTLAQTLIMYCLNYTWLSNSTHVKPPQALRLQKTSPELSDGAQRFRLDHRLPRTQLLVLQPLPPELHYLLEAELLVWCVARHCYCVQPPQTYNDTMEDTFLCAGRRTGSVLEGSTFFKCDICWTTDATAEYSCTCLFIYLLHNECYNKLLIDWFMSSHSLIKSYKWKKKKKIGLKHSIICHPVQSVHTNIQ